MPDAGHPLLRAEASYDLAYGTATNGDRRDAGAVGGGTIAGARRSRPLSLALCLAAAALCFSARGALFRSDATETVEAALDALAYQSSATEADDGAIEADDGAIRSRESLGEDEQTWSLTIDHMPSSLERLATITPGPLKRRRATAASGRAASDDDDDASAVRVAVSYTPTDARTTRLPPLWTRASAIDARALAAAAAGDAEANADADAATQVHTLARLRPNTNYTATLWVSRGGGAAVAAASAPFASSASGCDAFDAGVGAATLLHGTATWGVVLTPWVEGSCDDWEGLVGLDAEGFIVWYYKAYMPGPADQLSDGTRDVVMLTGGGALMYQNEIRRISPNGTLVAMSLGAATQWTGPDNCTCKERCVHLSHECREVVVNGSRYVLTEQSTYKPSPFGSEGLTIDGETVRPDLLYSYELWLWDALGEGAQHWTRLADLAHELEFFPHTMASFPIESIYAPVEVESCAVSDDGDDAAADDAGHSLFGADDVSPFSGGDDDDADATSKTLRSANIYHVSSADVLDDLIVISLRNTNAIVALHVNGSGVAWVVASPGALAGANATSRTLALGGARAAAGASVGAPQDDAFFTPHGVKLLAGGRVLFIDDGRTRRGCKGDDDGSEVACWSRAVELQVDVGAGTAEISAQLEWPMADNSFAYDSTNMTQMAAADEWNAIGGSFLPIPTAADALTNAPSGGVNATAGGRRRRALRRSKRHDGGGGGSSSSGNTTAAPPASIAPTAQPPSATPTAQPPSAAPTVATTQPPSTTPTVATTLAPTTTTPSPTSSSADDDDDADDDDEAHYLVGFTSTEGNQYYFWDVVFDAAASAGVRVVATLVTSSNHGLGVQGTYRATPIASLNGESHIPALVATNASSAGR